MMKATIHDVAKRAGVSVATVSRVVNGNYPVKEATRQKVQDAIDALEYVPNLQARELNLQHSTTIGVVAPGFQTPFTEILDGVEQALRQRNYAMLLACGQHDPKQEAACIRDLMGRNVSGLVVVSPHAENFGNDFYQGVVKRMPVVFVNSSTQIEHASYVFGDEKKGAEKALAHLLWHGHQRILFVRGDDSDSCRMKEQVYRELMEQAGILNERYILSMGGSNAESMEHAARRIARYLKLSDVSAIFCSNDLMGVSAVNACKSLGKSVPEDISVVGFGNIPLFHCFAPRLTTVDRNMIQMGKRAAEIILEKLGGAEDQQAAVESILVEGETTAACKEI